MHIKCNNLLCKLREDLLIGNNEKCYIYVYSQLNKDKNANTDMVVLAFLSLFIIVSV